MTALTITSIAIIAMVAVPSFAAINGKSSKVSALSYHDDWRRLWEDHIWWTRMVIIGVFDDLAGTGNYTERLLQNVPDMVSALKPYYGTQADDLGKLLKDHLVIAAQILTAAKGGQNITSLVTTWYDNAKDIAMFMNHLNPKFWRLDKAEMMWKSHLDFTLQEAVSHLTKDWAGDIAAFEKIHALALVMADFFSEGVMMQFPFRFTNLGNVVHL